MAGRDELQIVYEDDCLIVVEKPGGLLTMSTGKQGETTAYSILTDYVRHSSRSRYKRNTDRIYIVHRLDRYTSGLLVFAKDPETKNALQDNWNNVVLERKYIAVVEGTPQPDAGVITSLLHEDPNTHIVYSGDCRVSPERRSAPKSDGEEKSRSTQEYATGGHTVQAGKFAITHYKVLKGHSRGLSLVEFELETGRKNQIRVHAAGIGHPVAGDKKYGARTNPIGRLALHARTISFIHPYTGETMKFDTGIPRRFKALFQDNNK